jgi:hypothetical protein
MPEQHLRLPHYHDDAEKRKRLALVRVDLGATADSVARKCLHDYRVRYELPEYRKLMENDRFMIAILTGTNQKATAIENALENHKWSIRFRTAVIPDLLQLLP